MASAAWLGLAALSLAAVGDVACSGNPCRYSACRSVIPIYVGFTCGQMHEGQPATILRAVPSGVCTANCQIISDAATGGCESMQLTPSGAGECDVRLTSSNGTAFSVVVVWEPQEQSVPGCPPCDNIEPTIADAGPGLNECVGEAGAYDAGPADDASEEVASDGGPG